MFTYYIAEPQQLWLAIYYYLGRNILSLSHVLHHGPSRLSFKNVLIVRTPLWKPVSVRVGNFFVLVNHNNDLLLL